MSAMTSSDTDVGNLTESQQASLETYISVTNQDLSAAIPLLQRSEWNVQIAIAKFFDGEGPDPVAEAQASLSSSSTSPPPAPQPRHATTLLDAFSIPQHSPGLPAREPAPRVVPQSEHQKTWRPPLLVAILLSPFNLLTRLVGSSFSLVGFLFSLIPRLLSGGSARRLRPSPGSGRRSLNPTDTAARFAREFEEEYGQHDLHFFDRGYAQAYDLAKKDLKFLLVILLSPEHDDTSTFVHETLLSSEVVNFVNDPRNNIIIWAGNVQDSEAYQVSNALNCSKFPCAVLIAYKPQDTSAAAMSVIARVFGLQPPAVFVSHLRSAITKHSPALERTRTTLSEQQAARDLREEQNSAYERSLAQDRERARQRREAETARKRAEEEEQAKARTKEQKALQLTQWREWRAQSISPEPGPDAKNVTRISVRMTTGDRVIRKFAGDADMEDLYAFIDCYDILQGSKLSTTVDKPADFEHDYNFRLVSPMPRIVYNIKEGGTVGQKVGRSGNLIVEPIDDDDVGDDD